MHQYSNLAYINSNNNKKKLGKVDTIWPSLDRTQLRWLFLYQTIKLSATPERKGEVTCQTLNIHMYKNH